jgi:hypothetical protein
MLTCGRDMLGGCIRGRAAMAPGSYVWVIMPTRRGQREDLEPRFDSLGLVVTSSREACLDLLCIYSFKELVCQESDVVTGLD